MANNGTAAAETGCPTVTLGDNLKLQARTWGLSFTAEVYNVGSDPSKAERAGYIQARLFDWNQRMTFYNNQDQVVAQASKPYFSWGVDRIRVSLPSPSDRMVCCFGEAVSLGEKEGVGELPHPMVVRLGAGK